MTKKHYVEVARTIKERLRRAPDQSARDAIALLANDLAAIYRRDNPAFNFERFFTACGLD